MWIDRAAIVTLMVTVLCATTNQAQGQRQVTVDPEFRGGGVQRRILGDGYRDLWTTPVTLPVLDFASTGGGLTPVRKVGQAQTLALALSGADGRSYTFRSLRKHPERMLPEEWRNRLPERIARDQSSHTHPAAATILPGLAEAAGVAHTTPRLVVMPDDPALGQFREEFANRIGTIEEFPLPATAGTPGFMGATAIVSTRDLWKRWLEGPQNRINHAAYLRARILDLWVDNFDRHRGQWRWMRVPGKEFFEPLPEDPDMAFVHHDGALMTWMRGRMPRFLEFSEQYPKKLDGPLINNFEIDRWLLSALSADDWRREATDLQQRVTDAAIENAVRNQPTEWFAINGQATIDALKARRAGLVAYVMSVYRFYAGKVDIHATDRHEAVTVARDSDNSIDVAITVSGEQSPWYHRRFTSGETDDIRIYLHGGDDRVTRTGPAGGPIAVRVIAGGGADRVDDSASGGTDVWRDAGTVQVQEGRGTGVRNAIWTNPDPVEDAPWVERRSFGHWTIPAAVGAIASDVGLVLGYSFTRTAWDFRAEPNKSVQTFTGMFSTGRMPGKLEYVGTFRFPASRLSWRLQAFGSSIERHDFFGFGNDSPREKSRRRYRSFEDQGLLAPTLRYERGRRLELYLGPELRYSSTTTKHDTILSDQQPLGFGRFGQVAVRGGIGFDSREPDRAGAVPNLFAGEPGQPTRIFTPGIKVQFSAFAAPKAWDVESPYGGTDAMIATYVGRPRANMAFRVGGRKLWGDYTWFESATIGGSNDRGFASHRFAGDSSLFGSLSFSSWVGVLDTPVLPIRIGLTVGGDVGRVWVRDQQSKTWHDSIAGGVLVQPLGLPTTLSMLVSHSREGYRVFLGAGYPF